MLTEHCKMQAEMPAVLVATALLAADVESCAMAVAAKARSAMDANFILCEEYFYTQYSRRCQGGLSVKEDSGHAVPITHGPV